LTSKFAKNAIYIQVKVHRRTCACFVLVRLSIFVVIFYDQKADWFVIFRRVRHIFWRDLPTRTLYETLRLGSGHSHGLKHMFRSLCLPLYLFLPFTTSSSVSLDRVLPSSRGNLVAPRPINGSGGHRPQYVPTPCCGLWSRLTSTHAPRLLVRFYRPSRVQHDASRVSSTGYVADVHHSRGGSRCRRRWVVPREAGVHQLSAPQSRDDIINGRRDYPGQSQAGIVDPECQMKRYLQSIV